MIEGIPSPRVDDIPQKIDYSGMIRSLFGQEYSFFVFANPVPTTVIQNRIGALLQIQTQCSSMLKRNFSLQQSFSKSTSESQTHQEGSTWSLNGTGLGALVGLGVAFIPGVGLPLAGLCVGVGAAVGSSFNYSKNKSDSYTKSISDSVTSTYGQNFDVQNYFAKELMEYAESSTERMKKALSNGCWETLISYSAEDVSTLNQIQGTVFGDIAKPSKTILPPRIQRFNHSEIISIYKKNNLDSCLVILPKEFLIQEYRPQNISAPLTSQELAMFMSIPEETVPGFEMKQGNFYSYTSSIATTDRENALGHPCECERIIENINFHLDSDDLNKHTFICGITGCGKTNSVKRILETSNVPFLVIECAKKEYRSLTCVEGENIFTPGNTELNCLHFNPFYIQPGITLQTHIDYLKDLFNASFSFYGPMTYILETCLHRIYQAKGWNLTTGDHPLLVNNQNYEERYDNDTIQKRYGIWEHRFLFPTMSDLLKEVNNYINNELQYDGEVAGNIRSAMRARMENLCMGAKGYMLDNDMPIDMNHILSKNTVVELEGLADDSDKAFIVGLLIFS